MWDPNNDVCREIRFTPEKENGKGHIGSFMYIKHSIKNMQIHFILPLKYVFRCSNCPKHKIGSIPILFGSWCGFPDCEEIIPTEYIETYSYPGEGNNPSFSLI